ncbi:hypothetical protein [Dysgonomonas sp. ZJ279]|uniref:hypothetical protein n=1 Tax=Dysgonomonas sp. ZJ279 TaxID=2709796 RepID=UPI0013ECF26D|nr:hypothetical protein [Dysgonomonas sp. ZJ279]
MDYILLLVFFALIAVVWIQALRTYLSDIPFDPLRMRPRETDDIVDAKRFNHRLGIFWFSLGAIGLIPSFMIASEVESLIPIGRGIFISMVILNAVFVLVLFHIHRNKKK